MATLINNPFKASLLTDGCSSLELSCDCKKITFKDTSNYTSNDLPGHAESDFTSRKITITKSDGSTFSYITVDIKNNDPVTYPLSKQGITYTIIPSYAVSNNQFNYSFIDTDEDGIYSVEICTYPNWRSDVYYQSFLQPIVLYNGKLYKAITSSTNVNPEADASGIYWSVYTDTSSCSNTRYCNTQKIVVLCISVMDCYRKSVSDAFCSMQKSPCKDMCDNKAFMKAMKMRVVMDGLEFASCGFDWENAKEHIDILKSLCCCN